MNKFSTINKLIITALCIALCTVLPQVFHAIPNAGSIFLPLHIPVLMCGLICGWQYGAVCGITGPVISSLLMGMPGIAMLPAMVVECAVYGFVSGLLSRTVRTGKRIADTYISLVAAMLAGRVVAGLANACMFTPGEFGFAMWTTSYFITGIPGIIAQLIILPSVVLALTKAGLIPDRYSEKNRITQFFDRYAPKWDAHMIRNEEVIKTILDNAGVREGKRVLDVACGTGVLIPDYLTRKATITAIDLSPKMLSIAKKKFRRENVQFICDDVEEYDFETKFDCIMVYNSFPHFLNQEKLIEKLVSLLKSGGTLTIAHGMSRAAVNRHHEGAAHDVSVKLMETDSLAELMQKYLEITSNISNGKMYLVTGKYVIKENG